MRILCVGLSATIQRTICFDSFSAGTINRSAKWREDASGKALNAARVLNQIEDGCSVAICPVGKENADAFLALASRDSDLHIQPIFIEGRTRECWTLLDKEHGTTTELVADEPESANQIAGGETERDLIDAVQSCMERCDALLLAGSRPAAWTEGIFARICGIAHKAGKPVLADFRGKDLLGALEVCAPQIIKINEDEFCQTFGGSFLSEEGLADEIAGKSRELRNIIVVTRGEKDTLAAQNGEKFRCPAEKITPVNTTACGDSFDAGFLHEYLTGKNVGAALKAGTHAAALNAENVVPGAIVRERRS